MNEKVGTLWDYAHGVALFFYRLMMRFLWWLVTTAVKIISLGRFDLTKADLNSSAPRHIWGLLWPYLVSTRPWTIVMPEAIYYPRWTYAGWQPRGLRSIFWAPLIIALGAFSLFRLAPDTLFFILNAISFPAGKFSIWTYLTGANVLGALGACWLLHKVVNAILARVFTSVKVPTFNRVFGRLRLPYGGLPLFTLPVLCQSWLLIALIGGGCWLVNTIGVQANGLQSTLTTSLQKKDAAVFVLVLWQFSKIMGIMTLLGPAYALVKEFLILGWTKDATALVADEYTDGESQAHYVISMRQTPDNPNERIQQDLPNMCRLVLKFLFKLLDAVITLYMFGRILWNTEKGLNFEVPFLGHTVIIEHMMLTALILYAVFGTNGATLVGSRLIGQNQEQRKREAHFRVLMVMFEKYAEPIAAYHGEKREREQLWRRFDFSLANNYVIVRWQMLLAIFTGAYGTVAQFLPLLTLAPFYFAGIIEMGAISSSAGACAEILGALSLVVSGFNDISLMLAFGNRSGELREELARIKADRKQVRPRISRIENDEALLSLKEVDLYTPGGDKLLVRGLNLDVPPGVSVLIRGASGSGKTSLLRAIQGLPMWDWGSGTIEIAPQGKRMMLTQLAYLLAEGSLREQLLYPGAVGVSDAELLETMRLVNLSTFVERLTDDLKKEVVDWHALSEDKQNELLFSLVINWDSLSGGEKQRLVAARAIVNKVQMVLADEATSGLDIANEELLYRAMKSHGITLLSVGHRPSLVPFHEVVVELLNDGEGGWEAMSADESKW